MLAVAQPVYCYTICSVAKTSTRASMVMFFGNIVLAQILVTVGPFVERALATSGKNSTGEPWLRVIQYAMAILRITPSFALGNGLSDLNFLVGDYWRNNPLEDITTEDFTRCDEEVEKVNQYQLECSRNIWDVTYGPGRNLLMLAASLLLWLVVLIVTNTVRNSLCWKKLFQASAPPLDFGTLKDDDVIAEEQRMADDEVIDDPANVISACNVRKVFSVSKQKHKYVHAVQGVSFGTCVGEVFGLLGVNGAGKSTMFKMLVGEEIPLPKGRLRVNRDRGIGYCPQHDPLWSMLTCREHLIFTCRVKGINDADDVVTKLMKSVDLTEYADVMAKNLSGGNKRKLCVAMSLIGTPKILFLDEPSAGVDPLSRRFLWGMIRQISECDKASTVILTTHSMEECEALCTRTAIMVNGVFRCIGPNTRIRNNYGKGATLDLSFFYDRSRHNVLLSQWNLPDADVITYQQVRSLITGEFPLHEKLLYSSASCFISIINIVAEKKKVDLTDEKEREIILPSACAACIVTQWWTLVSACEQFVAKLKAKLNLEELTIEEIHGEKCRLRVDLDGITMNEVFRAMEEFKKNSDVEDYTLSRATLESIFNAFAREPVNNKSGGKVKVKKTRVTE